MESFEAAESLATTIRIGSLSLELEELNSKVVGAQLGFVSLGLGILDIRTANQDISILILKFHGSGLS